MIAKMIPNLLGAQAHISTTQQLFLSWSDEKTNLYFPSKKLGGTQGTSSQYGKI